MLGVMDTSEALALAQEKNLDLVAMSLANSPPVCKIASYGKLKYDEQKRNSEQRKKRKQGIVKEIGFFSNIGRNDYLIKLKKIKSFLEQDFKVKVVIKYKGRSAINKANGVNILNDLFLEIGGEEVARKDYQPKIQGNNVEFMLSSK